MLSCQWTSFTVVPGPFIMSPYFLELPYFPRALDPFIVESYLEMEICMLVVLPANRFYYFLGAKKKKKARKYTLHNTYTHTQTHIYSKISCSSPNSELFFFFYYPCSICISPLQWEPWFLMSTCSLTFSVLQYIHTKFQNCSTVIKYKSTKKSSIFVSIFIFFWLQIYS